MVRYARLNHITQSVRLSRHGYAPATTYPVILHIVLPLSRPIEGRFPVQLGATE